MTESNTALREALHRAIDDVLDSFENGHGGSPADAVTVVAGVEQGPWTYRWPDGVIEPFSHGRWYKVSGGRGDADLLVAWCRRDAWGRERERAIVFYRIRED